MATIVMHMGTFVVNESEAIGDTIVLITAGVRSVTANTDGLLPSATLFLILTSLSTSFPSSSRCFLAFCTRRLSALLNI